MRQTISSDFSNSISQVIKKCKTSYIEKGFVTDEAITDFNISLRQNNLYEILECENQKEACGMHYEPRRMEEKIVTIFDMIKMRSKKPLSSA